MRNANKNHNSGITLLELLVVIVIMAIVITISMPAFTSIGRGMGLRNAVTEVSSTLSLARQWAITKREEVTFASGVEDSAYYEVYTVYAEDSSPGVFATNYVQSRTYLEKNITITPISFTFKTSGDLSGIQQHEIHLEDTATSIKKTITVYALTGGIKVE